MLSNTTAETSRDLSSQEREHSNTLMLREIYSDLTRLGDYAHEDIVLHLPERGLPGTENCITGRKTINEKQRELTAITKGALAVEVEHVFANDYFGIVVGKLMAQGEHGRFQTPICGLWRFVDGLIVEVWENAYHAELYHKFIVKLSDRSNKIQDDRMDNDLIHDLDIKRG